jgi:hypothetical protein
MLWYLSFVDEKKRNARFLGACVVRAESFDDAIDEAKRRGYHPGGSEVAGGMLDEDAASLVGDTMIGTLLQRFEGLPELDTALGGRASALLDMRSFTVSNHHVILESTGIRMISARWPEPDAPVQTRADRT